MMKARLAGLALSITAAATAHAGTIYTSNLSAGHTLPSPAPQGNNFQLDYNGGSVAGISTTSFSFVFSGVAAAITTGASSKWGAIILDTAVTADPYDTQDNGAFLAFDGDYDTYPVNIAVTTVAGQVYTLTFDWAAAQEAGFFGDTTDGFQVALGDSTEQSTAVVDVPQQGFSGWMQQTMTFTADSTGTVDLSFLAAGSPAVPPFALLDNINVSTSTPFNTGGVTPEPNSLLLLGTGLLCLGVLLRIRSRKISRANA